MSEHVAQIVHLLQETDVDDKRLETLFSDLKHLSREKEDAKSVYTDQGIRTLIQHAFQKVETTWSQDAKRCLANALTLEDSCVELFLQARGLTVLLDTYSERDIKYEDEFILSRILFLVTAKSRYAMKEQLAESIDGKTYASLLHKWLMRHLNSITTTERMFSQSIIAAFCELLKLMYNVATFSVTVSKQMNKRCLPESLAIIILRCIRTLQSKRLLDVMAAVPHCINLLTAVPQKAEDYEPKLPNFKTLVTTLEQYVDCLLEGTMWYGLTISEDQLAPLLTLFVHINDIIDDGAIHVQMKATMIVPDSERNVPLGRSNSLAGKLLKLLGIASQSIRECVSALLFQVSGSSAENFIDNVGYGHAIGFLTAHGIQIPAALTTERNGVEINPITGQ